jgi:outer membrane lipoprotein-sorting protein
MTILVCAIGCLLTPAYAEDSTEAQVMAALAQVKAAHGTFTEKKFMSVLTAPLEDSGTLTYTAPDHLEKQTLAPKPESLLVDGNTLTVTRDGDTHTVDLADYPEVSTFIESIRSTLAGNSATLDSLYTVAFSGTFAHWQLTLTPRSEDMQEVVKSVRLSGAKGVINTVETEEADGDRTEMTITEDR